MCPESTLPPLAAMKSPIYWLENRIKQLKRNHHDDDIALIKNESFFTEQVEKQYKTNGNEDANPLSVINKKLLPQITAQNDPEVLMSINKALACEISTVKNAL